MLVFKNGKQKPELLYKTENCPLQAGDRVRMSTGGGGGYGDPKARPLELVQRDVIRGLVSRERARRLRVVIDDYGRRAGHNEKKTMRIYPKCVTPECFNRGQPVSSRFR